MNYDTYDCRLNLSAAKATKALRRKAAKKNRRLGRGENRVFAAIRAVTAVAAAVLACAEVAEAQNIVIQPLTEADSKDARLYEFVQNSQTNLFLTDPSSGARFVSVLEFNLASLQIQASDVASAYISLYSIGVTVGGPAGPGPGVGGSVSVNPILESWDEGAVRWSHFFVDPASLHLGATATTQVVPGTEGWVTFDVTNLVRSWLNGTQANNGVMFQADPGSGVNLAFYSAGAAGAPAGSSPSLTIVPVPEPGAAILAVTGAAFVLARRRPNRSERQQPNA